jgi:hypothetical protein
MEKMTLLKSECVEGLKQSIADHLDRYRTGDFSDLLDTISVDLEIDYAALSGIKMPHGKDHLMDVENCAIINVATKNLTPFAARDERLWVHLCHGPLLEYARKRWPIPDDEQLAISSIRDHFFAGDKRKLEARNAASRLYWLAHIAARVTDLPLEETLSLILHRQDIRQQVVERPTVLQAEAILVAVINNLKTSKAGDERLYVRQNFRNLQERLNEYCGHIFVESLPMATVQTIVDQVVSEILSSNYE